MYTGGTVVEWFAVSPHSKKVPGPALCGFLWVTASYGLSEDGSNAQERSLIKCTLFY